MTEEQYNIAIQYKHLWDTYQRIQMVNISQDVKEALLPIYKELTGKQVVNLYCNSCVLEILRVVYNDLDNFERAKREAEAQTEQPRIKRQRSIYKKVKPKSK